MGVYDFKIIIPAHLDDICLGGCGKGVVMSACRQASDEPLCPGPVPRPETLVLAELSHAAR